MQKVCPLSLASPPKWWAVALLILINFVNPFRKVTPEKEVE
ncbi:MAG: hypothetical protein HPY66_1048 [Firmicutes bacterium]|nr:hypothetical protein [Bacillota bacterium]